MNFPFKNEIWKDIKYYNGYQVSNYGRIRTNNKITYNKNGIKRKWKNRILKFKISHNKYHRKDYRVDLWKDGKCKTLLVARLVAFTFYEQDIDDKKLTVNHIDGNSENNNINNLEIVTLKENINHAFNNKLYKSCKKIKIINKKTKESKIYRSMLQASISINKNHGYISSKIKNNIYDDENYMWQIQ